MDTTHITAKHKKHTEHMETQQITSAEHKKHRTQGDTANHIEPQILEPEEMDWKQWYS